MRLCVRIPRLEGIAETNCKQAINRFTASTTDVLCAVVRRAPKSIIVKYVFIFRNLLRCVLVSFFLFFLLLYLCFVCFLLLLFLFLLLSLFLLFMLLFPCACSYCCLSSYVSSSLCFSLASLRHVLLSILLSLRVSVCILFVSPLSFFFSNASFSLLYFVKAEYDKSGFM